MLACGAPCAASDPAVKPTVDPAVDLGSVRRIVGYSSLPPQGATAAVEKLLDGAAFRETLRLGEGKPDWNPRHPGWKAVYDRVRADIEAEQPAIVSAADAERGRNEAREREYLQTIASALSAADARAILDYYDSAPGLRYQGFMQRIDGAIAGGMASSLGLAAPPMERAPEPEADSAKSQRFFEMIKMSHPYQALSASAALKRDPSGMGALGIMAAAAIASHRAELEAILSEYSADLAGFEAFQKTAAAQSLSRAMSLAAEESAQRSIEKPPPDVFGPVRRRYTEEWRAAYRAYVAP